tara:strand:+ start:1539 stop:1766 length:228 start_codon:yes stop_codon:yes gene_type:complete
MTLEKTVEELEKRIEALEKGSKQKPVKEKVARAPSKYNIFVKKLLDDKSFCEGEVHAVRFKAAAAEWKKSKENSN